MVARVEVSAAVADEDGEGSCREVGGHQLAAFKGVEPGAVALALAASGKSLVMRQPRVRFLAAGCLLRFHGWVPSYEKGNGSQEKVDGDEL